MLKRGRLVYLAIAIVLLIFLVSSQQLHVTEEHPFYLNGDWVAAKDLTEGDTFTTLEGKLARITKINIIISFFTKSLIF